MVSGLFSAPFCGAIPFSKILDPIASPASAGLAQTARDAQRAVPVVNLHTLVQGGCRAAHDLWLRHRRIARQGRRNRDYASTRPHFEQWSAECAKASGGRSFGNLRARHGKTAAGKVTSIAFNDDAVYTGFNHGSAYVKRWPDPGNPELTRGHAPSFFQQGLRLRLVRPASAGRLFCVLALACAIFGLFARQRLTRGAFRFLL